MAQVINIQLPFFCGFYESIFYNCDTEYYAIKEDIEYLRDQYGDESNNYGEDLDEDDFEFNFEEYKNDVCEAFCNVFENLSPDFITNVAFDNLVSPRYYNFETDRIYANVTFEDNWKSIMLDFIKNNEEWLTKRIHDDWTSYDGFMSFMDNDYRMWLARFESDDDVDERYINAMLTYMMYKEDKEIASDIQCGTMEDIYVHQYVELIERKEETA